MIWILGYIIIAIGLYALLWWAIGRSSAIMAAASALWPLSIIGGLALILLSVVDGAVAYEMEDRHSHAILSNQHRRSVRRP